MTRVFPFEAPGWTLLGIRTHDDHGHARKQYWCRCKGCGKEMWRGMRDTDRAIELGSVPPCRFCTTPTRAQKAAEAARAKRAGRSNSELQPSKLCSLCCGLAHRVKGDRCRCGLEAERV